MSKRGKFFDLVTMENEYKNIHKLYTVVKEILPLARLRKPSCGYEISAKSNSTLSKKPTSRPDTHMQIPR